MASTTSIKSLLSRGYFQTQKSTLPWDCPHLHPDIELWRAVIDRGLRDLMLPKWNEHHKDALEFFDPSNDWLQSVCEMAFIPEEEAIRMSLKILNLFHSGLALSIENK